MTRLLSQWIEKAGRAIGEAFSKMGPDYALAQLYTLITTQGSYVVSPRHARLHRWFPHSTSDVVFTLGSLLAFALGAGVGSFWGGVGIGVGGGLFMILWWVGLHSMQLAEHRLYPPNRDQRQTFEEQIHLIWARNPQLKSFTEEASFRFLRGEVQAEWGDKVLQVLKVLARYRSLTWESLEDTEKDAVMEVETVHIDTTDVFVDATPEIDPVPPRKTSSRWSLF